jgi:hypothetical protein
MNGSTRIIGTLVLMQNTEDRIKGNHFCHHLETLIRSESCLWIRGKVSFFLLGIPSRIKVKNLIK